MIIAIAAEGTEPGSQVSKHGARAPFYLLYDDNGKLQQSISNPYASAERGAGPRAAQFLSQQNVQLIVAGSFGGRFVSELEAGGIKHAQKVGIVSDAIDNVLAK